MGETPWTDLPPQTREQAQEGDEIYLRQLEGDRDTVWQQVAVALGPPATAIV